jgi:hypothetical protein
MSATPQQARKEIFAMIGAGWAAKAPAILAPAAPPEMRYQGHEKGALPGSTKFWARSSTQLATTRQSAHMMPEAPGGSPVEFASAGVVFVQVFAPMSEQGSYAKGELLAEALQCMFMAAQTASGVWFRNPRINEVPPDGTWYIWNVIAEYQFNQVKGA